MAPSVKALFDLTGRKALVVGAGSGLGQAGALALAEFGAEVVVADLNTAGAEETVRQITAAGGTGRTLALDVTSTDAVNAAAAEHADAEVLVITPGYNARKRLVNTTDDDFDKVIDINLKGTYRLMRAFGDSMAERGGGSIITFASFRALVVEPGQGLYAAAKAGVVQLTKTMATELGTRGVRVNALLPGAFETPLTQQIKADPDWWSAYEQKSPLRRWGQPHEIGGAIVFLASDASSFVTGSAMLVDGGWMANDGRFEPKV
ncbi:MAG: SDR family oxidoreductase [Actinomycetota bacterium]|nr:SDR family oxidoreductase [Actinomycetota bacterium]